jgi:pimeloyl-ACP methyl ester carboxylesterase
MRRKRAGEESRPLPRTGAQVAMHCAGEGPPALLLHGQPGGLWDWDEVVAAVGDDVRTIAIDRPGYGRTSAPPGGLAWNAEVAAELLDELALGPALIVGHSWGGGVALALARQRPDLVSGLVLLASIGTRGSVGRTDRALAAPLVGPVLSRAALRASALALSLEPVRRRAPGVDKLPETTVSRIVRQMGDRRSGSAFAVEQRALVREIDDLDAALPGITVPAFVLVGDEDRVVGPRSVADLASRLPGAELVSLPGTGHVLPDEAPGAVAEAMRGLL